MKDTFKHLLLGFSLFLFVLYLFFTGGKDQFSNALAIGVWMIFLWVFEVIPIYITALIPVIFAVPMGVMNKQDLALSYGNSAVFLFLGGFLLALALEKWDVHQLVARRIILLFGQNKKSILLGFIVSSGLLSMWISNTATALMMLPMGLAIVEVNKEKGKKFSMLLILSIATAANIGGLGTLVGSPPNVQMASLLQSKYHISVTFTDWIKMGLPLSVILLFLNYMLFYALLGKERNEEIKGFSLEKQKFTPEQRKVSFIFLIVVLFWVSKDYLNQILPFNLNDEVIALAGASLLFIIPINNRKHLLEWKDTEKLPWGILLLFGGGMALAQILEGNGIIDYLTNHLNQFQSYPMFWILFLMVFLAIFASEILSNLALVTILIPVIVAFSQNAGLPVVPMAMALTFGASCAFMLPIGTPPNAIVFSSGLIHMNQMVKIGFLLNIIALLIIVLYNWLLF